MIDPERLTREAAAERLHVRGHPVGKRLAIRRGFAQFIRRAGHPGVEVVVAPVVEQPAGLRSFLRTNRTATTPQGVTVQHTA